MGGLLSVNAAVFDQWMRAELAAFELALDGFVPNDAPAGIGEVMRYAVLGGGKRLRPLLVLAACDAVRGEPQAAMRHDSANDRYHQCR